MATAPDYNRFLRALKAAGDPLRAEILRLLARDSFGVLELAHMLDVSQPALSHHLKILSKAGLVTTRRDGTSIYYRRCAPDAPSHVATCRATLFEALDSFELPADLRARRDDVYRDRAARSRAFFRDNARAFDDQRALICPADVYLGAVEALLPVRGRQAVDVGPGDGEALELLAKRFLRVLGVDNAKEMLARAAQRIDSSGLKGVALREAEFTDVKRPHADFILMAMVLHHAPSPQAFIVHAASLLSAGGRLVVVELVTHTQDWTREACGDLWLGFEPDEIVTLATRAGLVRAEEPQYLAQRNGFRIQVHAFDSPQGATS